MVDLVQLNHCSAKAENYVNTMGADGLASWFAMSSAAMIFIVWV